MSNNEHWPWLPANSVLLLGIQKSYEEPKFLKFHLESTQKFDPATIQTLIFAFEKVNEELHSILLF